MNKWRRLLSLLPFLVSSWALEPWEGSCSYKKTIPLFSNSSVDTFDPNLKVQEDVVDNCKACMTIWHQKGDTIEVLEQGCFPNEEFCDSQSCIANAILGQKLPLEFQSPLPKSVCCCIGSMCNQEFRPSNDFNVLINVILFSVIGLILVLAGVIAGLFYKIRQNSSQDGIDLEKRYEDARLLMPITKTPTSNSNSNYDEKKDCFDSRKTKINLEDLDRFEILDTIHQGQFSTIYKVAREKTCYMVWKQYKDKQKFSNERDVYEKLVSADYSVFLQFFGSHGADDLHRIICLEYAPQGSLASHLKTNTLSWSQLCAMLIDISTGMSKLHNTYKIVHRKVCSTNIFVRDLNHCCIGDFSHALTYENLANFSPTSTSSSIGIITDDLEVIRYLAPELLDDLVNVSWTQADIYSLGLLFWEMSLRCHELYQGVNVPSFQMAYEREIGLAPSKEQMKIMVSRNKARPLFPEVWKNSNPAIQQLKETILDSWDHDGEARLTASCIRERVRELEILWNRYKLVSAGPPILDLAQPNNTQPRQEAKKTVYYPNVLSTSELASKLKNDNVISGQKPLVKIQPHQGTNPCLERNYMSNIEIGNTFNPYVVGSFKDKPKAKPISTTVNAERQAAPYRMRPHFAHPIPHLQNDIQSRNHGNSKNQRRTSSKNQRANDKSFS